MFRLRYYQNDARAGVRAAFDRYRSTAVIMPTATGKTELYLSLAVEESSRVLVLVHRDYLITSPINRLARAGFTDVAVEKAQHHSERGESRAKVVFASVQSIGPESQLARLREFDPRQFSLLIIDEGHRAPSPIYRRVQTYFEMGNPRLKTLVLTATPRRRDGLALGNVCESVAYEMTPATAAEEGWIAPPRFFVRDVPSLDFSHVNMRGPDFDPDKLAELLTQEEPLHRVLASLAEDQGPTIVFCPKVAVAQAYALVMSQRYRPDKALAIHEGSTDDEMEKATKGLADGTIDYVFNVDKLTEGYDVPRVVRVAWAAPTASLVRWTQGCGRGFRPDAGVAGHLTGNREDAPARRLLIEQSAKPFCSIVTYYPSNCEHQICSAVDLLGGRDMPADVYDFSLQVQQRTARQEGGSNPQTDIETAVTFCDLRAAVEEARRHIKARATVNDEEYDGLGETGSQPSRRDSPRAHEPADPAVVAASWGGGKPATQKQINWLRWKGVPEDVAASMTSWQASTVRDLFEAGVSLSTAIGYPKRQALKILENYRNRQEVRS